MSEYEPSSEQDDATALLRAIDVLLRRCVPAPVETVGMMRQLALDLIAQDNTLRAMGKKAPARRNPEPPPSASGVELLLRFVTGLIAGAVAIYVLVIVADSKLMHEWYDTGTTEIFSYMVCLWVVTDMMLGWALGTRWLSFQRWSSSWRRAA